MISRHQNRAKNGGYNFAPVLNGDSILNDYKLGEKVTLTVRIDNLIYHKPENGWSIYLVEKDDWRFKINGVFVLPLPLDNHYAVTGKVGEYNGERCLNVEKYKYTQPEDETAIIGVLRTIEELNIAAPAIYRKYGANILKDIINHPRKVARAIGYPEKDVKRWSASLSYYMDTEETFEALKEYGLGDTAAKELWDKYGDKVLEMIEQNPYFLIDEVPSVTFKKCDAKALENGYAFDGVERISYGILSILKSAAAMSGHCWLPEEEFKQSVHRQLNISLNAVEAKKLLRESTGTEAAVVKSSVKGNVNMEELRQTMDKWQGSDKKTPFCYFITKISEETIQAGLDMLLSASRVVIRRLDNGTTVYMLGYYDRAEYTVAKAMKNLSGSEYDFFSNTREVLDDICKEKGVTLEKKQYEAALRFSGAKGGIFILNGAAGCGKTFVLNIILSTLEKEYGSRSFGAKILAPTGKAAQVAHKATELDAATIHRELGLISNDPDAERLNPLIEADCLIIDEFSMVDIMLASQLFQSITPLTKVIILGDTNQLPSIGAGAVLKDLIESGMVETVTLDVVKRQTEDSGILENANRILAGEPILNLVKKMDGDAHVMEKDDPISARMTVLRLFKRAVDAQGLLNVQVLCPQKKTQVGTEIMNYCIQQVINTDTPNEPRIPARKIKLRNSDDVEFDRVLCFKKGDKVIHTKNNYKMVWYRMDEDYGLVEDYNRVGIINGEIGVITDVEVGAKKSSKGRITVKYDDGYVRYEKDFSELDHAYAITIHKAQGSQWPTVISPICFCNRMMLNRKLIYTLYTRAQTLSVVAGEREAMDYAVKNNENAVRYTSLQERLKQYA